jgi:AN1-type zinc finger protein 5/6
MNVQDTKEILKKETNILSKEELLNPMSPKRKLDDSEKKIKKEKKCKKKKKSKNRCAFCNKKVGIVLYTCRCNKEYIFCSKHRLPSKHNCSFDYKNFKKKKIENDNPKIEFDKFNKF